MMEGSGSLTQTDRQEREMTEALLSFAKYAIRNAEAHLTTVELFEAVELLMQAERIVDDRQIELAAPAEPGLIQHDADD